MRTKRQPTIKTMLLLMALVAMQCAVQREYIELAMDPLADATFVIFPCCSSLSGVMVWALLPLSIGLCLRSAQRTSAICFAVGCIFSVLYLWLWPYVLWPALPSLSQNYQAGFWGFIIGPFICLYHVTDLLWPYDSLQGRTLIQEIAFHCGWLVLYAMTCFLIARSCRLREQSGIS